MQLLAYSVKNLDHGTPDTWPCREKGQPEEGEKIMKMKLAVPIAFIVTVFMISSSHVDAIAMDGRFAFKRQEMVKRQLKLRGISDDKVLEAMTKVKRHLFVPPVLVERGYDDTPLPIGYGQTISQPYIVAYMTEAAGLHPEDRVLEIGTGCGYQAAVLSELVKKVYTIELLKPLANSSRARLKQLGYENIEVKLGDGYEGWPEHAPFDAIIVTAAPLSIPEDLVRQLKVGGRMIVPVGSLPQELYLVVRTDTGFDKKALLPVRFVPMVKR